MTDKKKAKMPANVSKKQSSGQGIALRRRRTKIIATIGPASDSPEMIRRLLGAGVNVVRLNMSHGDPDSHRRTAERVRREAARLGTHVAIMIDLSGPKIRVGRFAGGSMTLRRGQSVIVTMRQVLGSEGVIPSQYPRLARDVRKGQRILLDDGNLELRVESARASDVRCRVIEGGVLRDHKGMNLPDSHVTAPALTAKDKRDARLAVALDADFVALSFVRSAADVRGLRRFLTRAGRAIPIISKIERPEAVDNIDEILEATDGIMIARGDLGVELPAERVPLIQRDLIARARSHYVPVIVATQMLESMVNQARPTRAEVTDVAGAAFLSADAVMLSAETASGKYPLQAVNTMDRVLREVEREQWQTGRFADAAGAAREATRLRDAMARAAVALVRDLRIETVVVPTRSGTTMRIVAAHRLRAPTVGVCADPAVARRMTLLWGVVPVQIEASGTRNWRLLCTLVARRSGLARKGHRVLVISGFHDEEQSSEPVLKILPL